MTATGLRLEVDKEAGLFATRRSSDLLRGFEDARSYTGRPLVLEIAGAGVPLDDHPVTNRSGISSC